MYAKLRRARAENLQLFSLLCFIFLGISVREGQAQTQTFSYNGAVQQYTATSSSIQVVACGAQGGSFTQQSGSAIIGGLGGCITAVLPVSMGSTLYVYVGGAGVKHVGGSSNSISSESGGFNGGGNGAYGGGGGGASDVRTVSGDYSSR